jgi:polyhydroxyalkanoate synthesis regulator phasin
MKLNPVQEALLAHFKQSDFEQTLDEYGETPAVTLALRTENDALKARVEYLEQQIATNAFGGWQIH